MADSISGAPFTKNETGRSLTRDYQIIRGKAYLNELVADTGLPDTTGWEFLGNSPVLTASLTKETIDHITSQLGVREPDAVIVIDQGFSFKLDLQEMNRKTGSLFFSATPEAVTNGSILGFTKFTMIPAAKLGSSYEIVNSSGVRCRGILAAHLVLECGATLLVEGEDYEVDEAAGEVLILSTSEEVEDGDPIDATLTANALAAADLEQLPVHSRTEIEIGFKFNGMSARKVNGVNRRFSLWVPKASLVGEGDFSLLSPPDVRDIVVASFTGKALRRDSSTALAYLYPLPVGGVS